MVQNALQEDMITIERIMTYRNLTPEHLHEELRALDTLIDHSPENPLLYSARARVKGHLGIDNGADLLKRLELDPAFIEENAKITAKARGTNAQEEADKIRLFTDRLRIQQRQIEQITTRAMRLAHEDFNACLSEVSRLVLAKKYTTAQPVFDLLLQLYPHEQEVLFCVGVLQVKLKNLPVALDYFKQAYQINPSANNPKYITHVIGALFDMKQYESALQESTQALQVFSDNSTILEYQAKCHLQLGQTEAAQQCVTSFKNHHPDYQIADAFLKSTLGEQHKRDQELQLRNAAYHGNFDRIKELVEAGVDIHCVSVTTLRTPLMWLCRGQGKFEERAQALECLLEEESALDKDTDGNTYVHHLILCDNFELLQFVAEFLVPPQLHEPNRAGQEPAQMLIDKRSKINGRLEQAKSHSVTSAAEIKQLENVLATINEIEIEFSNIIAKMANPPTTIQTFIVKGVSS